MEVINFYACIGTFSPQFAFQESDGMIDLSFFTICTQINFYSAVACISTWKNYAHINSTVIFYPAAGHQVINCDWVMLNGIAWKERLFFTGTETENDQCICNNHCAE